MATNPKPAVHSAFDHVEEQAWFGLLRVHAAVSRRIDAQLAQQNGLTSSSYEIMVRLDKDQPQAVRALADQLVSISPSRASRVIQDLVDQGYVRRDADQRDGRVSLIALTPQGRRALRAGVKAFYRAVQEHFLVALDEEDVAALTRIWAKLDDAECL